MRSIEDWNEEIVEDAAAPEDKYEDRYRVVIEFIVDSESVDDAEATIKDIIDYGILGMLDNEDRKPVASYDVIDADPAELE